jgi:hypothetical protein
VRTADLATAALLFLMGVVVAVEAWKLGTGWGTDGPESGFFPFWLGLILSLTSVAIVVLATFRTRPKATFVTGEKLRLVLKVAWPAAAMVVLTHVLGLYVASALYLGLYMRWIGRHSWVLVVVLSLGIPFVTFLIFETWFLVPMPKGPLEGWLGY